MKRAGEKTAQEVIEEIRSLYDCPHSSRHEIGARILTHAAYYLMVGAAQENPHDPEGWRRDGYACDLLLNLAGFVRGLPVAMGVDFALDEGQRAVLRYRLIEVEELLRMQRELADIAKELREVKRALNPERLPPTKSRAIFHGG